MARYCPPATYVPTKSQIRAECETIRRSWSEIKERQAAQLTRKPWRVPVIAVAELDPRLIRAIDAANRCSDTFQDV